MIKTMQDKTLKNFKSIFLDFDGTITKQDTVGSFFMNYAGPGWEEIEKDWVEGKINSKTCMLLQLETIKNLSEEKLYNFLDSIEIQDGFVEFCKAAEERGKKVIIISDGFDLFISRVLENNNLLNKPHIKFFANRLKVSKEKEGLKFNLTFPNEDKNCAHSLGNCKCARVKSHITKDEFCIYAGDGLSDRCIASKVDLLFAKNSLKKYCLKNNMDFVEFEDFFQISDYLFKEGTTEDARVKAKERKKAFRG